MIYYAVIDTNVLVSAMISSNAGAATVQIICRLISGVSLSRASGQ